MQIGTFTTINPNMSNTRTFGDFSKWLGEKPARFGIVSRMHPENTIEYITEALGNIFYNDYKKSKFQNINSMYYEWEIETNEVKRVALADTPVGDGQNGAEITMAFTEHYYNMNDIFELEDTKQQFFVVSGPVRQSDVYWEYQVRILDNSYDTKLEGDNTLSQGSLSRWIGCAFPELHEYGKLYMLFSAVSHSVKLKKCS